AAIRNAQSTTDPKASFCKIKSFIQWRPYDGVGRAVRNGLNFTERGFGIRGALGIPDRGHTAASQLQPGDFDWQQIFGDFGTRWFHTGGIFSALSETTAALTEEAIATAKKHNVIVSYDLNYRPSLWRSIGGLQRAQQINRRIVQQVDVVIGNEEDFTACLGLEVKDLDLAAGEIKVASFENMTSE